MLPARSLVLARWSQLGCIWELCQLTSYLMANIWQLRKEGEGAWSLLLTIVMNIRYMYFIVFYLMMHRQRYKNIAKNLGF
jgi:hypothetical protein